MAERDLDAEFNDIIARWNDIPDLPEQLDDVLSDDPPASGPDAPTDRSDSVETGEPTTSANPVSPTNPSTGIEFFDTLPVWRGADGPTSDITYTTPVGDAGDDDNAEDFVPRPVSLPPQEDLHFWGIVLSLTVGPLLLIYAVITRPSWSNWWLLAGFGLIFLGFVLLVLRAPTERDESDDGIRL